MLKEGVNMVGQNQQNELRDNSDFIICFQKALIILKKKQELFVIAESSKEDI